MPQNYGAFEKVLRVGEGRRLKRLAGQADYVASLEPDFEGALRRASSRPRRSSSASAWRTASRSRISTFEAFAAVREAAKRIVGMRPLRRPGDGRDRAPRGRHRRDEDRRGQDARRHDAALPERAPGARRAPRDGERLPRQARRRVDGPGLRGARACGPRFIRNQMPFAERKEAYAADITYGTNSEFGFDYLRDNMATSLQGTVAAEPRLRDRGRGRLDPDRRGADAADHLRRAGDRGHARTTTSRASSRSSPASPPSSSPRA